MNDQHDDQLFNELDKLEKIIAQGLAAYDKRNRLIVRLVESGISQAEVTRRLNKVRDRANVATLGPCAVAATMRRVYEAEKASA
jgi:coenzyme F420-reducing hydrogenase gamma subunit